MIWFHEYLFPLDKKQCDVYRMWERQISVSIKSIWDMIINYKKNICSYRSVPYPLWHLICCKDCIADFHLCFLCYYSNPMRSKNSKSWECTIVDKNCKIWQQNRLHMINFLYCLVSLIYRGLFAPLMVLIYIPIMVSWFKADETYRFACAPASRPVGSYSLIAYYWLSTIPISNEFDCHRCSQKAFLCAIISDTASAQ